MKKKKALNNLPVSYQAGNLGCSKGDYPKAARGGAVVPPATTFIGSRGEEAQDDSRRGGKVGRTKETVREAKEVSKGELQLFTHFLAQTFYLFSSEEDATINRYKK